MQDDYRNTSDLENSLLETKDGNVALCKNTIVISQTIDEPNLNDRHQKYPLY